MTAENGSECREAPMTRLIDEEIRYSTLVKAPPETVYDGIATARGLDGWFTAGAEVDARPGGVLHFRWREWGGDRATFEERGRVLEAERPRRFVFEWHPDSPDYATTVEIDFEPAPEGTLVRLVEHGYRDTPSGRRQILDCACGWGEALTCWKFWVEHGLRY